MKKIMSIPVVTVLALSLGIFSACTIMDPDTGETKVSKTAYGVGLGAAGGALAGYLLGDGERKSILIGAGIGALAGGAIGNYMDQQEAILRQATEGTGVELDRKGNQIVMTFPEDITFGTGSAAIKPSFGPTLDRVAESLIKNNNTYIDVRGHTDSVGTTESNMALSRRRAQTVGQALVSRNVQKIRIATEGFGESEPVADNGTVQGRALNRRVEIVLTPIT